MMIIVGDRTCKNCLYLRRLKHNFTVGKGYEESKCCVVLLEIEDGEDGWAQEVKDGDFCEMFERRIRGAVFAEVESEGKK